MALTISMPTYGNTIRGAPDCGDWIASRNAAPNPFEAYARGWLLGYLSGFNVMLDVMDAPAPDHLISPSPKQIYLWVDNYCKQNPLATIDRAGNDLFIELEK